MYVTKTAFENRLCVDGITYRKDTKLADMLSKAFNANIVMAWSTERISKHKGEVKLNAASFVVLKSNGKYSKVSASEWCSIEY